MYNVEHPNRKIYSNPDLFIGLKHDMPFATDTEINNALKLFFWNWSMCYDDVNFCTASLQNFIDIEREYWLHLYRTTTYKYDPLVNYNITISETVSEDEATSRTSETEGGSDNRNFEKPFDGDTEKERTQNKTSQQSFGKEDEGKAGNRTRTYTEQGDKSLRSLPEFIEIERRTIISLLNDYVQSFKRFFYLDL